MKRAPAKPVKLTDEQIRHIENKVFQLVESHLEERFYLLAVDFEKEAGFWYLRLYIEGKDFRVSLNDCEAVSRHLDTLVEGVDELSDIPYSFEVSSPGLFRPLKTAREYAFYQGRPVLIQEAPPREEKKGRKLPLTPKTLQEGILLGFDADRNIVKLQPKAGETPVEMELGEGHIVYLNPEVRFPEDDEDGETLSPQD